MTLAGNQMASLLVGSPSSEHLARALRPRFARLFKLDHSGWMRLLADDGYSALDIKRLEGHLANLCNEIEFTEKLARVLEEVRDLDDQSAVNLAVAEWLKQIGWDSIWKQVCDADFPDPIDAGAYAGACLLQMASGTLRFESLRRNSTGQDSNWIIGKYEVQEGLELAEAGLAEEAAEWPPY